MLKRWTWIPVMLLAATLSACARHYVAYEPPPPPRTAFVARAPYRGAVWVPGHYQRDRWGYARWIPGHWR